MKLTCIIILFWGQCELPPAPPPVVVCPPLQTWAADYQRRLAAEIERLPPGSALSFAMREHLRLRDQLRRCRGK